MWLYWVSGSWILCQTKPELLNSPLEELSLLLHAFSTALSLGWLPASVSPPIQGSATRGQSCLINHLVSVVEILTSATFDFKQHQNSIQLDNRELHSVLICSWKLSPAAASLKYYVSVSTGKDKVADKYIKFVTNPMCVIHRDCLGLVLLDTAGAQRTLSPDLSF